MRAFVPSMVERIGILSLCAVFKEVKENSTITAHNKSLNFTNLESGLRSRSRSLSHSCSKLLNLSESEEKFRECLNFADTETTGTTRA